MKDPTVTVIIEKLPIKNGNMKDWTNYSGNPEVTITTNSHQTFTDKNLKVSNSIEYPTLSLNYKTKNKLIYSGNDLGLVKNNIHDILKNYNIIKDGEYFISILVLTK